MGKKALIILASGKSSRFGGFPKALCTIEGKYIAQHTIDIAGQYYDDTYLVLNKEIYGQYQSKIENCHVVDIETGIGDAHSLLRALLLVKDKAPETEQVTVCWGDTVFSSEDIFKHAKDLMNGFEVNAGYVICAEDENPYAWFDTEGAVIKEAHFASNEPVPDKAVHDQSVFVFDMDCIISQLQIYRDFLGISENMKYSDAAEMKTLNAFTFFYGNNMKPVLVDMIASGLSRSFNTKEEFDDILEWWRNRQ
jgi:molybdopterin-guanine dinucleotide biosynthesis protein A